MNLIPTDNDEVSKLIKTLKNNKAPGLDYLTAEMLKNVAEIIAPPIAIVINKIFETGDCPKVFKTAVVKPLFKTGDKQIPENYRPISLISNVAKIFEKVLVSRVKVFLKKYQLTSENQFGFQDGLSTQDAIITLVNQIQESLDEGSPCLCIFIDLAKAFDTVNHVQLLSALSNIGIRGTANKLFKSYLQNREQHVMIGNVTSDKATVNCGVPQGTVLGPLLFTVYVNDLFQLTSKGKILALADDTAIFYKGSSWTDLKQKAETDMLLIKEWFDWKLLTVNYKKTKFISFTCHNYNRPSFKNLSIANDQGHTIIIEHVDHIKYLGVYIDQHLRWETHVLKLSKKLRCLLFKFKILKQVLELKTLKTVYYALVDSLLQYGIAAWGTTSKNNLKIIESLQKRFLKTIFNKPLLYPTTQLYIETKILDLRLLYFKNIVMYQFKNKHKLEDIDHHHNTRSKTKKHCKLPRTVKKVGQKSVNFLGPRLFNLIPEKIRSLKTPTHYKKKIVNWILAQDRQKIISDIEKYLQ